VIVFAFDRFNLFSVKENKGGPRVQRRVWGKYSNCFFRFVFKNSNFQFE